MTLSTAPLLPEGSLPTAPIKSAGLSCSNHTCIPLVLLTIGIIACLLVPCGCAAPRRTVAAIETSELDSAYLDLREARYGRATAKYLLILQQEPNRPQAEEARFRLGECYFHMRAYMDAGAQFQRYLSDYPDGAFANDARQYIAKLRGIEEEERQKAELRKKEMLARLKHWRDVSQREPDDAEALVQVGHALWDLEEYEDAAREYLRAIKLDTEKRHDRLISSRLSFEEDGTVTVLTPAELERRERERNPIVVSNTHAYRGGRDIFTYEPRWFIVTGQVVNRSSGTVRDVGVLVTIFDFAGHVLDSAGYRIGAMRPGQVRAFSVRFTNFENIYNIDRYECEPVF